MSKYQSHLTWGQITNKPTIPTLPDYITSTKITSTTIESPTITAASIIGGEIKSDTIIDVGTDLRVGNNVYLGELFSGTKRIYFNGAAQIFSTGNTNITISAENTFLNQGNVTIGSASNAITCGGNWNFTSANVTGLYAKFK